MKILLILLFFISVQGANAAMIKEPNVAGQFYTEDAHELSAQIDGFLKDASVPPLKNVEVIIAPHAGYMYSGGVAGFAFKALQDNYKTVVVIAPSHYFALEGISIWSKGGFKTPLGIIPVDEGFAQALLKENGSFKEVPQVFEREHALEVELPFIQKTLPSASIVPIIMGKPDAKVCQNLAKALDKLVGDRMDVLIVISSDMSHYHSYEDANRMDSATLKAITQLDAQKVFAGCLSGEMEMCGFVPVTTALVYAQLRGLKAQTLKYANSGDTATDRSRVVGYSAVAFFRQEEKIDALSSSQKKELLAIARQSIEHFVKTGKRINLDVKDARLNEIQGAFVTIHKDKALRGCIGNIIGQKPLAETVRDMAIAAASEDPRFEPLREAELKDIDVEVSVLSKPKRVKDASEIVLGKHGVIVSDGGYRQGVFLPQVAAETGWSKEEFLSQLCSQKAGLSKDAWKDPAIELYTFTADVFHE